MAFQWMRRVLLALAPAALLALAACDSSTIESQFRPTRIVAFGDALSDMGQTGAGATGRRYMIDNSDRLWLRQVGISYEVASVAAVRFGGGVYATGNARVNADPDAAGNPDTPTIKEQIDAFLAAGGPRADDLVTLQGGISDVFYQVEQHRSGAQTREQMLANVRQAALDFAAQARRLAGAGAKHIVVMGMYDLSITPWGISTQIQPVVSEASRMFNETVLVDLVQEGENMLFVDTALLFNLMVNNRIGYGFDTVTEAACGQVSAYQCTTANLPAGANQDKYLWADALYPTLAAHARLGDFTYTRISTRW